MGNDDLEKNLRDGDRMAVVLVVGILLVLLLSVLCGCSRKVYVPVERMVMRTDTVTHYINNTDSVTVIERVYESDTRYDSVAPILDSLNRVIGWDRYHFRESTKKDSRELERLRAMVDSLKSTKAESVTERVPYPVERELTKWERTKMNVGGWAMVALIIVVTGVLAWLYRLRQRRG